MSFYDINIIIESMPFSNLEYFYIFDYLMYGFFIMRFLSLGISG